MKTRIFKILFSHNRGSSLPAALIAMSLLAFGGTAVTQFAASGSQASSNDLHASQAMWITHAGLEDAVRTLRSGVSPTGSKDFGEGSFTVSTQPQLSHISVQGNYGHAKKDAAIIAQFSKDCVQWDNSTAFAIDNQLCNVRLIKTCNDAAIMTEMVINWNWDPCVLDPSTPIEDLQAGCPVDTGGAMINKIAFNGNITYDPALNIGAPNEGAASGNSIDVLDSYLYNNDTYLFFDDPVCIQFTQTLPSLNNAGGLYTMTANFADGSSIQDTFLAAATSTEADFEVDPAGPIDIADHQILTLEVLGSEITYGANGPEVPVYLELGINDGTNGNYNFYRLFDYADIDGGEVFTVDTTSYATTDFCVRAKAHYRSFNSRYDCRNQQQILTLVDGDRAPPLAGFGGQKPISTFLAPYLDNTGHVVLENNQVIILGELGTDMRRNPSSPAADFQDIVIIITIDSSTGAGPANYIVGTGCNQGIGNGAEGCDPGNSNQGDPNNSNDEN